MIKYYLTLSVYLTAAIWILFCAAWLLSLGTVNERIGCIAAASLLTWMVYIQTKV
jgi:hypothetical protein